MNISLSDLFAKDEDDARSLDVFTNSLRDISGNDGMTNKWNDLFDRVERECHGNGSLSDLFDTSCGELDFAQGCLANNLERSASRRGLTLPQPRSYIVPDNVSNENQRCAAFHDKDDSKLTIPSVKSRKLDTVLDIYGRAFVLEKENVTLVPSGQKATTKEPKALKTSAESVKLTEPAEVSSRKDDDSHSLQTFQELCLNKDDWKDSSHRSELSQRCAHRRQNSFATLGSDALELYGLSLHSAVSYLSSAAKADIQGKLTGSSHHSTRRGMRQRRKMLQRNISAASSTGHSWISEISSLGMGSDDVYLSDVEDDDKPISVVHCIEFRNSSIHPSFEMTLKGEKSPKKCHSEDVTPKRPTRHLSPAPDARFPRIPLF